MLEGVPMMAIANVCVHRECPSSLLPLQEVPKVSKWVRPESLQIIASALGLRVSEILHVSFRSGVSASYSPLVLL